MNQQVKEDLRLFLSASRTLQFAVPGGALGLSIYYSDWSPLLIAAVSFYYGRRLQSAAERLWVHIIPGGRI